MLQHPLQNNNFAMGQANRYLTTGEVSRESIEQSSNNNFLEPQHDDIDSLNHGDRYSLADRVNRESIEYSPFKQLKEPHFFQDIDTRHPSIGGVNLGVKEYDYRDCRDYRDDARHQSFNNNLNIPFIANSENRQSSNNNKLFSFELPYADIYPNDDDGSNDEGEREIRDEVSPLDSVGLLRQRVKKRLFNASPVCGYFDKF